MTPTQEAAEREAFEALLKTKPESIYWNTTDAMFWAFVAARATLSQQGGGAVEPGYKVVPVEPTPEMLRAAQDTAHKHLLGDWDNGECNSDKERADKSNREYYRAMLTAAPPAPQEARGLMNDERKELDRLRAEAKEARDYHHAAMLDAYQLLGLDASDGEVRYKWVAAEIADLKRRAEPQKTRELTDAEVLNALNAYGLMFTNTAAEAMRRALEQYEAGKSRSQPCSEAVELPPLLEAANTILETGQCICPEKMRREDGRHMSGCWLFDLNIAATAAIKAAHPQPAAPAGPVGGQGEVTDAMVEAYLRANDEYWQRTDRLPEANQNPSRWRQGNVKDATRESLAAALAATPTPSVDAEMVKDAEREIPEGVLKAIRLAGLTLVKNHGGYQLRNLGIITAQSGPICGNCDTPFPPGCKGLFKDDGDICLAAIAAHKGMSHG